MKYDVVIVGGGIVGLATAYQLSEHWPDKSIVLLEKEDRVAAHQTGHNSGVVHAGLYYTPGSLTTPPCTEGVLWIVMRQPMTVSRAQIDVFARLVPMNARPLQDAAGRLVKQSIPAD